VKRAFRKKEDYSLLNPSSPAGGEFQQKKGFRKKGVYPFNSNEFSLRNAREEEKRDSLPRRKKKGKAPLRRGAIQKGKNQM